MSVTVLSNASSPAPSPTRVGVGVYLIKPAGQLLLMHRISKHGNDTWAPPGGGVEFGEDPAQTAMREVQEEVSLVLSQVEFIGYSSEVYQDSGYHYLTFGFAAKVNNPELVKIGEPHKCDILKWVAHNELPSNMLLSTQTFINKLGSDAFQELLTRFSRL
jgi:8-oxo-dGTP diphosphatase